MVDTKLRIWDNMILNNRKETYDIKLSKRRIQFTGRGAARSGQSAGVGARVDEDSHGNTTRGDSTGPRCRNAGRVLGASLQRGRCEARPATGEKREVAAHGSEARRKDQRPGNPGGRAPRIYPGVQARVREAAGRQRAQPGHHPRAERSHRRPQVPAGDANQLRSRRRITNRGLRAPSDGANRYRFLAGSPDPATSSKRQASSSKQQAFFQSIKPQAASIKLQAASDKLLDRAAFIKFNGSLLVVLGYDERVCRVLDMERNLVW